MHSLELVVNGKSVSMNEFVERIVHDIVMAILSNLRDVDIKEINRIEVT